MIDWYGIIALIAVSAIFGADFKIDKSIINSILKGDENMNDKIEKIKGLILDKVTAKVDSEDLTIDEYEKVVALLGHIAFEPKTMLPYFAQGFNGGAKPVEEK